MTFSGNRNESHFYSFDSIGRNNSLLSYRWMTHLIDMNRCSLWVLCFMLWGKNSQEYVNFVLKSMFFAKKLCRKNCMCYFVSYVSLHLLLWHFLEVYMSFTTNFTYYVICYLGSMRGEISQHWIRENCGHFILIMAIND